MEDAVDAPDGVDTNSDVDMERYGEDEEDEEEADENTEDEMEEEVVDKDEEEDKDEENGKEPRTSVSNGSRPSLWIRFRVRTEPLPNWWSGLIIYPNRQFGHSSMQIFQPFCIGRVVSRSPSRSICRFI
jgi:hypothetical protein